MRPLPRSLHGVYDACLRYGRGMPTDPRVALQRFTDALEEHLAASRGRRSENDPTVVDAYQRVADAFDAYDEALMDAYGEVTPLEIYDGDEDDLEDRDDDLDEDDEDTSDDELVDGADRDSDDEDEDEDDIEFVPRTDPAARS